MGINYDASILIGCYYEDLSDELTDNFDDEDEDSSENYYKWTKKE